MKDEGAARPKVGKDWKPPESFKPETVFKPRKPPSAYRHISLVEAPYGTYLDRVRLRLNQRLITKPTDEKELFRRLMFERHDDWFLCACWDSSDMSLRITLRHNQHLAGARMDVGRHADEILAEIFANRPH